MRTRKRTTRKKQRTIGNKIALRNEVSARDVWRVREPGPMRIVMADDDEVFRFMISEVLRRDGHYVMELTNGEALLSEVGRYFQTGDVTMLPDLFIIDYVMPGLSGIEVLKKLNELTSVRPFVFISGFASSTLGLRALDLGAVAVLKKSFLATDIIKSLRSVVRSIDPGSRKDRKLLPAHSG